MKRTYKILFWTTLTILVISNIFWIYERIDSAVGHDYYKVSCDEYYQDMLRFKEILETIQTKPLALDFLEQNRIKYDSIQKGDEYIIVFSSFSLTYDKSGNQISVEE